MKGTSYSGPTREKFGIDYVTVSQERKRLREKIKTNNEVLSLMTRIEGRLSTGKI